VSRPEDQAPGDAPTRRRQVLLPLASGALCGTLTVTLDLVRNLGERFDCRLALPAHGPALEACRSAGLQPHAYDLSPTHLERVRHTPGLASKLRAVPSYLAVFLAAWRELRAWPPDLVHVCDNRTLWSWGVAARLQGLPLVWHVHQVKASPWLDRLRLALVRGLVFSTGPTRRRLEALGAHLPPCLDLPNPVDTERFRPGDRVRARRRLGLDPDRGTLGFVGHLTARKRPHLAVEAFLRGLEAGRDLQMAVLGGDLENPGEGRRLAERVAAAGHGTRFHILGVRPDLEQVLPALDVLLVTSTRDGEALPRVVLEAMACGIPVLTTDTGGVAEVVRNGHNGVLVDAEDFETFCTELIRLTDDPELRLRLGQQARRQVSGGHDPAALARCLGDFYDQLLGR